MVEKDAPRDSLQFCAEIYVLKLVVDNVTVILRRKSLSSDPPVLVDLVSFAPDMCTHCILNLVITFVGYGC